MSGGMWRLCGSPFPGFVLCESGEEMTNDRSLRVYYGPDDDRSVPLAQIKDSNGTVEVPLKVLFETMTDATVRGLAWTEDFNDEKVTVSTDFFEVISAYRNMRKSA